MITRKSSRPYKRGTSPYYTVKLTWYEGGERRQLQRRSDSRSKTGPELDRFVEALWAEIEGTGGRMATPDTVGGYVPVWLDSLVVIGRAPTTIHSYSEKIRAYVLPRIGAMRLADVDTATLDRLYADLLRSGGRGGRPLSARTVRFVHSILRKAFADAVRKQLLSRNPAVEASAPSSSASRAPEPTVWTPAELRAFLAGSEDSRYRALWWLLAFTGMRRSEALALRWDRVDLDQFTATVAGTISQTGRVLVTGKGKTAASMRTLELDEVTVLVLRAHRAAQASLRLLMGEGFVDRGLVFCQATGQPLRPDSVSQAFKREVASSGLPRIRLHDLRHGHASHSLAAQASLREVADRLGHADPAFTLRTYTHSLAGSGRRNAEAVARLVADS
jgi:integrase